MISKMLSLLALAAVFGFYPGSTGVYAQQGSGGGLATKENLDLPFDALGSSDDDEDAPEVIVFYGQQYEANFVAFCCDKSGSMNEPGKFPKLQREVIKNISQFSDKVQFGIAFFDKDLSKFPTNGKPADANPGLKAAALSYVMSTTPGHGTCSKPALEACLQYANQSSAKEKVILYLSDGHNTCPGSDENVYKQQVLAEIAAKNTQHVKINTICIGTDYVDEQFMRTLATQNNGKSSRVTS
jgi:von Willebrand factor type A domain-containing protein